jgi:CrcB protein
MIFGVFLLVCGAGGIGSALRFVIDGLIRTRYRSIFPYGTTFINITGSLALGLITGLALSAALPVPWSTILGTGLVGGYTTFSTASVETMRLVKNREYTIAATNGFLILVVSVLAGLGGFWIGSSL